MTAIVRSLRSPNDEPTGPESPEALMISALIDSCVFNPEAYRVDASMLSCWHSLWKFCEDYQRSAGEAPPPHLVKARFPDWSFIKKVDPGWAAKELRRAHADRELRFRLGKAINHLQSYKDLDAAYAEVQNIPRPVGHAALGRSVLDEEMVTLDDEINYLPVPFPTWASVGKGIGAGEFVILAGRPEQGKSYLAAFIAAHIARAMPVLIRYVSLEMPARQVRRRIQRCLAGRDHELRKLIDSTDPAERATGIAKLAGMVPGVIEVVDPRDTGAVTTGTVRDMTEGADLVIVDPMGLLLTSDGKPAIDDWRNAGQISQEMRKAALSTDTPILGLHHVNRKGDGGGLQVPRLSDLADADNFGRDADVVINIKRLSDLVMAYESVKMRDHRKARWWSVYDPANVRFHEISKEDAMEKIES